jgi:hypothetical protein
VLYVGQTSGGATERTPTVSFFNGDRTVSALVEHAIDLGQTIDSLCQHLQQIESWYVIYKQTTSPIKTPSHHCNML